MFGNLPIGKGWGQLTKIFVSDITSFCALLFCGDVGNQKKWVSCSSVHFMQFPSKIVLSDMAQCPSK